MEHQYAAALDAPRCTGTQGQHHDRSEGSARRATGRPVLYGEPVIDPELAAWATTWMREAAGDERPFGLTITGGASDAIDRLLELLEA